MQKMFLYSKNMSSKKYKIDPKNPWKDPRGCMALPGGCDKPICQDIPNHDRCKPIKIQQYWQPKIDERKAQLAKINAQLAAEHAPCNSIQGQIVSIKSALADCNAAKAACERSNQGGAGRKSYGTHHRAQKNRISKKGGTAPPETAAQMTKRLEGEAYSLRLQIEAAQKQVATGAKCSVNLNSLSDELAAIKAALADCDAKKAAACEASKPIDNGTFNLNTRADLSHIRGAGRKVYGTYQRGPKKGKLKKGFKFVNGVATKVI